MANRFEEDFIALLPNSSEINIADDGFWAQHGVNFPEIRKNQSDENWINDQLSRLDSDTLKMLVEWLNLGVEPAQPLEELTKFFVIRSGLPAVQLVLCLIEFIYNKQVRAIESISKELLPSSQVELIENNLTPNYRRFTYALLVLLQNASDLRFLILFDLTAKKNFGRYTLIDNEKKLDLSFTEQWINDKVLPEFDSKNCPVKCVGVRHQSKETIVFIRRALRETSVPEVERYVFAKEAELIVLKFIDGGMLLEEHSQGSINKRPIGIVFAETILSKFSVTPCEYEVLYHETELEKVTDLLEYLSEGNDLQFYIREIYLSQASMVVGNPTLILKSSKIASGGISRSLKFFKNDKDIDLLKEPNLVKSIGVAFRSIPDVKLEPYIFDLYFTLAENGYRVNYACSGSVDPTLRGQFETYMAEQRNVQVTPVASDTSSPTIRAYHFKQILKEGLTLDVDDPDVGRTLMFLKKRHLVDTEELLFIKCVWSGDPDLKNVMNPLCKGYLELHDGDTHYECPECHRVIEDISLKHHFRGVRISLSLIGIRNYLKKALKKLEKGGHIEKVRLSTNHQEVIDVTHNTIKFPIIIIGANENKTTSNSVISLTFADPHLYVLATEDNIQATIVEKLNVIHLWDIIARGKNTEWLVSKLKAASYQLPNKSTLQEVETKLRQAVENVEKIHGGPKRGKSWEAFEQWFMPLFFEYLQNNPEKVNQYLHFLKSLQGTIFGDWSVRVGERGEPDWIAIDRYEMIEQILKVRAADAKFYKTTQISLDDVREVNGHLTRLYGNQSQGSALIMATTDHIASSAWREVLDYKNASNGKWRVMILQKSWLLEILARLDMVDLLDTMQINKIVSNQNQQSIMRTKKTTSPRKVKKEKTRHDL